MSFDWTRRDRRLSGRGRSSVTDTERKVVPALGRNNSAAVRRGGVMERVQAATAAKTGLKVAKMSPSICPKADTVRRPLTPLAPCGLSSSFSSPRGGHAQRSHPDQTLETSTSLPQNLSLRPRTLSSASATACTSVARRYRHVGSHPQFTTLCSPNGPWAP
jgi:hypothetical protein